MLQRVTDGVFDVEGVSAAVQTEANDRRQYLLENKRKREAKHAKRALKQQLILTRTSLELWPNARVFIDWGAVVHTISPTPQQMCKMMTCVVANSPDQADICVTRHAGQPSRIIQLSMMLNGGKVCDHAALVSSESAGFGNVVIYDRAVSSGQCGRYPRSIWVSNAVQRKYAPEYAAVKSILSQDTSQWALVSKEVFAERHTYFTTGPKRQHRNLQCVALVDDPELSALGMSNAFSVDGLIAKFAVCN